MSVFSANHVSPLVFFRVHEVVNEDPGWNSVPSIGVCPITLQLPERGIRVFVGMMGRGVNDGSTNNLFVGIIVDVGRLVGVSTNWGPPVGVQVGGNRSGVSVAVGIISDGGIVGRGKGFRLVAGFPRMRNVIPAIITMPRIRRIDRMSQIEVFMFLAVFSSW